MKKKASLDVRAELRRLPLLTVRELIQKYEAVFGNTTKSRNKPNLIKQISWRIQELHEGGLSERAVRRIADLGDRIPTAWQRNATLKAKAAPSKRDPRLPPVGAVLRRNYASVEHRVTVLENGFEYKDEHFDSLSTIAKRLTGKNWNGYKFFGLLKGSDQ